MFAAELQLILTLEVITALTNSWSSFHVFSLVLESHWVMACPIWGGGLVEGLAFAPYLDYVESHVVSVFILHAANQTSTVLLASELNPKGLATNANCFLDLSFHLLLCHFPLRSHLLLLSDVTELGEWQLLLFSSSLELPVRAVQGSVQSTAPSISS